MKTDDRILFQIKLTQFQVFPPKQSGYKYRLVWLPGPQQLKNTFIFHRKEIKVVDGVYCETGRETPFNAPFHDYPVILSHVPPHIMAINAGEKLSKLDTQGTRTLAATYGDVIADRCAELSRFYTSIIAVPNLVQPTIKPKASIARGSSPTKRSKLTHTQTPPASSSRSGTAGHTA